MCGPGPGVLSCELPHDPPRALKPTATRGPAWPRPVRTSTLALEPTWNMGFLQGQGQRTGLRPSESVGRGPSRLFSSLRHTTSYCFLLPQDAFFDITAISGSPPGAPTTKGSPRLSPGTRQTPAGRWGSRGCAGSTLPGGPVTFPSQAQTETRVSSPLETSLP